MKNMCKSCGQEIMKTEAPGPAHAPTAPGGALGHEAPSRVQVAKGEDWKGEGDKRANVPHTMFIPAAIDGPAQGYESIQKEKAMEQSPGSGGPAKSLTKADVPSVPAPVAKPKLPRPLNKAGNAVPTAKPPGGNPTPANPPMSKPMTKAMTAGGEPALAPEALAKAKMSPEAMSHAASDSFKAAQAPAANPARTGLTAEDHARRAAEFSSFTTPSHNQVSGHGTSFGGEMKRPKLPRALS